MQKATIFFFFTTYTFYLQIWFNMRTFGKLQELQTLHNIFCFCLQQISVVCLKCNVIRSFKVGISETCPWETTPFRNPHNQKSQRLRSGTLFGQAVGNARLIVLMPEKCCRNTRYTLSPMWGVAPSCLNMVESRHSRCWSCIIVKFCSIYACLAEMTAHVTGPLAPFST